MSSITLKLSSIIFIFIVSISAQEDHTDYIEGPFESPMEITATCLECHEGVEEDIMNTRHWKWLGEIRQNTNGENVPYGKKNMINNFCIAVPSNWPRCTSCHISYGWTDDNFDFDNPENIDCLICHDQTGTYKKIPTGAGLPYDDIDLEAVAQSVGPSSISNCGACHFNGGGGTGVKHGDLDESLLEPDPEIDFHMGELEFECSDCHAGESHEILGASHGSIKEGANHIFCSDCHDEEPHEKSVLNSHSTSVSCETCHIPTYAKEIPTKLWWDWSQAGKDIETNYDSLGMETYSKKKGEFIWGKDLIPDYEWSNGKAEYYELGDKITPNDIVKLNQLKGDIKDPDSKIAPFKIMRGKQIYDSKNNHLVVPKLFGEGGYWKTFSWNSAAVNGMNSVELEYSGEYGFIETQMHWPVNHMVASADKALKCTACHGTRGKKRLNWQKLGYNKDPIKTGGRFK